MGNCFNHQNKALIRNNKTNKNKYQDQSSKNYQEFPYNHNPMDCYDGLGNNFANHVINIAEEKDPNFLENSISEREKNKATHREHSFKKDQKFLKNKKNDKSPFLEGRLCTIQEQFSLENVSNRERAFMEPENFSEKNITSVRGKNVESLNPINDNLYQIEEEEEKKLEDCDIQFSSDEEEGPNLKKYMREVLATKSIHFIPIPNYNRNSQKKLTKDTSNTFV